MRNPTDVLREKMEEYKRLIKEMEALRIVIPLLHEPDPPKDQPHES